MPWETMVPIPRTNRGTSLVSSVSLKERKISLRLCASLVDSAGMSAGQQIAVKRGTGEHAGVVRLVPHPEGYRLQRCTGRSRALKLTIPRWPAIKAASAPATAIVTTLIDGGGVEIVLPAWARGEALVARFTDAKPRLRAVPTAPPLLDTGKGAKVPARRSV